MFNGLGFLLLPGRIFAVFTRLGIGARATIVHKNKMGARFRLIKLVYALDGNRIFSREERGAMAQGRQEEEESDDVAHQAGDQQAEAGDQGAGGLDEELAQAQLRGATGGGEAQAPVDEPQAGKARQAHQAPGPGVPDRVRPETEDDELDGDEGGERQEDAGHGGKGSWARSCGGVQPMAERVAAE